MRNAAVSSPAPARELRRVLAGPDITLLVVGAVIGSGIFIVPATVLRAAGGSLGTASLVWLVAGVLSMLGALTYAELSAMQPEAGGLYVYIRDAFGQFIAFLYGWTLFFVISSGAVATLAVAFASYVSQFTALSPAALKLVAVLMIVVVTAINVKGTRDSADVQNWTTAFKAGALLLIGVALLFAGGRLSEAQATFWPTEMNASLFSGLLTAMIGVLWAYEGWQYVTFLVGETKNPQKAFPRGLVAGTAILIMLYCLANVAYMAALGPADAMASPRIAADAVSGAFGRAAGTLITVPILVAMFSAANAIALTSPRVFYAMARDGVFFSKLAEVHPRFGTPAVAVVAMNAVAVILALTGTFEQLLTYSVFTGWIFYALGAASIFVYRKKKPGVERPFRTPGYPLTPILFVTAALVIVLNTIVAQPARAVVGIAIVLVGAPAYFVWQRLYR